MTDIDIVCRITDANGDWVYLNQAPYRMHGDALTESATIWRRDEVENPQVEGKWTVNAVRDNGVLPIKVWVTGDTVTACGDALEVLKTLFSQRNFTIQVSYDGDRYTHTCSVADFSVSSPREIRISKMAQFIADVPCHPAYTRDSI